MVVQAIAGGRRRHAADQVRALVPAGGAGTGRLLLDPGTLSGGFEELEGLSAVLVTHQHGDHLDLQRLRTLLDRNPGARVLCDEGSAEQLAAAGAAVEVVHDGEELDVGGVAV